MTLKEILEKRTRGKWKFGGKHSKAIYDAESGREICKVHFTEIEAMSNVNYNETARANAFLIALAGNHFEAAIEALRQIALTGEMNGGGFLKRDDLLRVVREQAKCARAVLAAIETEAGE